MTSERVRCWACGGPHRAREKPECLKKQRAYFRRPEVQERVKTAKRTEVYKEWCRTYRQRPEIKARERTRQQRQEAKARKRAYNQRPESRARNRVKSKTRYQRPEVMAWYSAYRQRPDVKQRRREYLRSYYASAEARQKNRKYKREWMREHNKDSHIVEWRKRNTQRTEVKARRALLAKNRRRRHGVRERRQTKPEQALERLLHEHFPGDWRYTGDGKVVIGRKSPDFFHVNGKKAIIELYGCYYHNCPKCGYVSGPRKSDVDAHRVQMFEDMGFRTLVVWEHELPSSQSTADKVRRTFYV